MRPGWPVLGIGTLATEGIVRIFGKVVHGMEKSERTHLARHHCSQIVSLGAVVGDEDYDGILELAYPF